jgi:kumamolisin
MAIPSNYQPIQGSERRPGPSAKLLGPANAQETFTVTIVVGRRPDGPPVPDHAYFSETPPAQRPRLSADEFAAKYGAAPEDLKKVTDFVGAQGLKVLETNAARRTVVASGTVAQMNKAFAVTLGQYQHDVSRSPREAPKTEATAFVERTCIGYPKM